MIVEWLISHLKLIADNSLFVRSIAISTVVLLSLIVSSYFLSIFELATAGSDAAIVLLIFPSFNSSSWELSNAGFGFGFRAIKVEFLLPLKVNDLKHILTTFSKETIHLRSIPNVIDTPIR